MPDQLDQQDPLGQLDRQGQRDQLDQSGRFFILGDIHACPGELEALLKALSLQTDDHVVCLGDYIDRGPDAKAVVDLLLGMRADKVCSFTFLKGNHEDMFLDFLGYGGLYGQAFLMNGGQQTIASYNCDPLTPGDEIALALPEVHREFFLGLKLLLPVDDILCVHAGVNPGGSLDAQVTEDLLWIREAFFSYPHDLPYTIVYGHTPRREVDFDVPYKVGIDTGLVYGGKLSCLEITEKKLFQIERGRQRVTMADVEEYWADGEPAD